MKGGVTVVNRRVAAAVAGLLLIAGACQGSDEAGGVRPESAREPALGPINRKSDWFKKACRLPMKYVVRIQRGHYPGRSPEIAVVPRKPNFFGTFQVTSHSGPWGYLQKVPLVFYGPGFIAPNGPVSSLGEVTLADLAPTLAELLQVDWPTDRPGKAIAQALIPEEQRGVPKMVLVVVWDGGGWNTLNEWPQQWPHLRELMKEGTSVQGVVVGSSPSVTPAIHATIGTGTWPSEHGVVDLQWRDGDRVANTFEGEDPAQLRVTTLADVFDPQTQNAAHVGMLAERNWHMGMIGHGATVDGGDKDAAVFGDGIADDLYTNKDAFLLPGYLREVGGLKKDIRAIDAEDGALDKRWVGHRILGDRSKLRLTPVQTLFQTRLLKRLFNNEGYGQDGTPDLFYTNYKQIDLVGHVYNVVNPEMKSSLKHADASLRALTEYLNRRVGENQWVLALTADHGVGPDPLTFGAWPINIDELVKDASAHFGVDSGDIFEKTRITGFWLNLPAMHRHGIRVGRLANFLNSYRLKDNVAPGRDVPAQYQRRRNERLFQSTFPTKGLPEIVACARG
jgi:predicted AlkP superfamily pyrophosphatase or phosphodiesterase